MTMYIGLDFETYGAVDLPKHGLDRYVNDSSFQVLIACVYDFESPGSIGETTIDFVLDDDEQCLERLRSALFIDDKSVKIAAHNSEFERAVLRRLGIVLPADKFVDSAVVARAAGAGSRLEAAAPQLTNTDKMEQGKNLIKLFSIPGKLQEANASPEFDPGIVAMSPDDWQTFKDYCLLDAKLGYLIASKFMHRLGPVEMDYAAVTAEMNQAGWYVDLDLVHKMKGLAEDNTAKQLHNFRLLYDPKAELNFASFPQLKKWCEDRGVKAKSFDEEHVTKYIKLIVERRAKGGLTPAKDATLHEVLTMLHTKQMLGGSSLKKLDTLIAMTGEDGRLRNQYLHVGAGQTWRTSGKGVQLQNLKRLTEVQDVDTIDATWSNGELAVQLRQVFKAQHPGGQLIVGDFSSVESRGLAYLAGEDWKLEAYRKGMDLYKMLAAKIDGSDYDAVTKDRRQFGKVGELSCGYGAGGPAVQAFAKKMGTDLTDGEAKSLVSDWRHANPKVLWLWEVLDVALKALVQSDDSIGSYHQSLANGLSLRFEKIVTPPSILRLHKNARSVSMRLNDHNGHLFMVRYFHGCYMRGNNVGYYKPSDNKTGDLWKNHYRDQKTGEIRFFQLYGGKLAGLLTQSTCREIFMRSLANVHLWTGTLSNVQLIGQFHDEIVLEWTPPQLKRAPAISLGGAMTGLEQRMSDAGVLSGFPLVADIKHDHRYTK